VHAWKQRASAAAGVALIASVLSPVLVSAAPLAAGPEAAVAPLVFQEPCPIAYESFTDSTGLNLVGSASIAAPALRITAATQQQTGAAWFAARVELTHGFSTDFTLRFSGMGGAGDGEDVGGDGMAFVVQDSSGTAIGDGGGSLGYAGIPRSLAVEFDTFNNGADNGDPDGNHVAVHSRGEAANDETDTGQLPGAEASVDPILLQDGQPHQVRVAYSATGTLDVFVDDLDTPVVTADVDLVSLLGLADGQAWVGFTGATGGAFENHDVESWQFCEVDPPPIADAGGDVTGDEGSAVALDAEASDPEGQTLTTLWSATPGPDVDAGATCTFADPAALDTTVSCTDDGSWTLTLSVDDGVNPPVTDTATLTLANAPPTVEITSPAEGSEVALGEPVALAATITDPGANDSHTCSISWGDGATEPGVIDAGACTGSHSYAASGTYQIDVSVSDDDLGLGSDTVSISVVGDDCTQVGTEGDDVLLGTAGEDVLCGLGGDDTLVGFESEDLLVGGPGDDTLRGGSGRDGIGYAEAPGAVSVSLADGWASGAWGDDHLMSIENVFGSQFDDRIIGDGDPNRLLGNGGRDHITARGAADIVDGGEGGDLLHGGAGNDRVEGGPSPTVGTIDRLFGDDGSRDVCVDGPGLADFIDSSCEQSAPGPGDDEPAGESGFRDLVPGSTALRRLSGRGPARPA
jgi:Ca2+-binding RTX toxin-like protein